MRRLLAALSVLLVSFGLAACGGSESSGPPCPPASETRSAVDGKVTVCAYDIRYDVKRIEVEAGAIEFTLINKGAIAHNLVIEGEEFLLDTPSRGKTASATITLEPGTYEFLCTISGHAQAGMKGTIVVS
ncbi:MAG: plastocyanin/azurin family copper-binding protein [Actinomycetota bacterium]